jgi:hypothetical protein
LAHWVQGLFCSIPIEAALRGRSPGKPFGLGTVLDRLVVVVGGLTAERMASQQAGDVQSGYRSRVTALQADMMTLDGERCGETARTRHGCLECAGRPVVDMTLGTAQAVLKARAIFAEVVEDTGEMALVSRSERSAIAGGQIGNPCQMLHHGLPLAVRTCGVGEERSRGSQIDTFPSARNSVIT